MRLSLASFLGLMLLWLAVPGTSEAATWIGGAAAGPNSWTVAANWQGNVLPTAGDAVLFDGSAVADATLNSPTFALGSVTLAAGFTRKVSPSNTGFTCASLSIAGGTFDAAGFSAAATDVALSGGTLTLATGAPTLSVGGSWNVTGGTFTPGLSSTVTFNGAGAVATFATNGAAFNNLTFAKTAAVGVPVGGALTVNGALSLSAANRATVSVTGGATTISGSATLSGGALTSNKSVSVTGFLSVASAGALTLTGTTSTDRLAVAGGYNLAGAVTLEAGDDTLFGPGQVGGTLDLGSASTFNTLFGDVTVTASGTITASAAPLKFGVAGTVNNAGTFTIGTASFNGTTTLGTPLTIGTGTVVSGSTLALNGKVLSVNGDFTVNSGGTLNAASATAGVTFTAAGAHAWTDATAAGQGYGMVTMVNSVTVQAATAVGMSMASLSVTGGKLKVGGKALKVAANVTFSGTSQLDMSPGTSASQILCGGSWTDTSTASGFFTDTGGNSQVVFNGTGNDTLQAARASGAGLGNLVVRKTTAGTTLTIQGSQFATAGALTLDATNKANVTASGVGVTLGNGLVLASTQTGGNTFTDDMPLTVLAGGVTLAATAGNKVDLTSLGTSSIGGGLTVGAGATFSTLALLRFTAPSGTVTNSGTLTLSAVDFSSGTTTLGSAVTVQGATVNGTLDLGGRVLTDTQGLIVSGTVMGGATAGSGVTFSGSGAHAWTDNTTGQSLGAVTTSGTTTVTGTAAACQSLSVPSGTLNVNAPLTSAGAVSSASGTTVNIASGQRLVTGGGLAVLGTGAFNNLGTLTFNNTGSWSAGTGVSSFGAVTVTTGTVTQASAITCDSLGLTGGVLAMNAKALNITGNTIINGGGLDASPVSGTASAVNVGGNWTVIAGAFTDTGSPLSTTTFTGTAAQTIDSVFLNDFSNLVINKTGGSVTASGNTLEVDGSFTLASGNAANVSTALAMRVGNGINLASTGAGSTLTASGGLTVFGGTTVAVGNTLSAGTGSLGGNLTGAGSATFSGPLTFTGTGTVNLSGALGLAGVTFGGITTVARPLTMTDMAVSPGASVAYGGQTLTLTGNLSTAGTVSTPGTIAFGTGSHTWSNSNATAPNVGAVTAASNVTLGSNVASSSLTVSGGTFTLGGNTLTVGDVTFSGTGSLDASPGATPSLINTSGNWTASGTGGFFDTARSSTVMFSGSGTASVTTLGGFASPGFASVSVFKTGGGSVRPAVGSTPRLLGGLTVGSGTLDLLTNGTSVAVGGDVDLTGGTLSAATASDLQFAGSALVHFNPGTNATTTAGSLSTVGSVTVDVQGNPLHVGGATSVGAGTTLAVLSATRLDGAVTLAGTLDLNANTTFGNDVALAAGTPGGVLQALGATPLTLKFAPGKRVSVGTGALMHVFTAGTQLVSSTPGTQWKVAFASTGVESFGAISVQDSNANPDGSNPPGQASNGIDLGNNVNWFGIGTLAAPAFGSASSATLTVGTAGSFAVTATGYPTPTLTETGALPSGVTFTDNGNGTATLAGTPAAGTGGTYALTLRAANSQGTTPQSFTLTVGERPTITSASNATFTAGTAGSFTVSTSHAFPTPTISETGSLPAGVTFTDNGNGTATLAGTATVSGTYGLTITASNGVGAAASQPFTLTVAAGAATRLVLTGLPGTQVAGAAQTVTVTALDAAGNVATGYLGTIHFASSDTGGATVLPANHAFTASDNGAHTFTVTLTTAGSQTVTATDTVSAAIMASATDVVSAASASKLAFAVQPSDAVSLQAIAPAVKVAVEDVYGNVLASSSAVVTVALGGSAGTLGGTLQQAASGGVASFANLTVDVAGAGDSLTASSSGLTSATSGLFAVTPGAPARLRFAVSPSSTPNGVAIAPAVQVSVEDASGNRVTSDSSTQITVRIGTNPGGSTLSGTLTQTASSGVATFANLSLNRPGTGYTLEATSGALTLATSGAFNVSSATTCTIGGVTVAANALNPTNPCQSCQPAVDSASWSNLADATACSDGVACTSGDVCTGGVCAGTPYTCVAAQCQASSVCDGLGGCTVTNAPAGLACDDGNPCTQTDACDAGSCVGTRPVVCASPGECLSASCNIHDGGCDVQPLTGTTCTGSPSCPGPAICERGVCNSSATACSCLEDSDCPALGACQQSVRCDADAGLCAYVNKADGAGCDDGDACTQTDACVAGACVGTDPVVCAASDLCHGAGACQPSDGGCTDPVLPDGTFCDGGLACLGSESCQAGVCVAAHGLCACSRDSDCGPPTACQSSLHCNLASGTCEAVNKPDLSPCDDHNACTAGEACHDGLCGQPTATTACAPVDACHTAGSCDTATGRCSAPAADAGAPCGDGGSCTGQGTCAAPDGGSSSSSSSTSSATASSSTGTHGSATGATGTSTGSTGTTATSASTGASASGASSGSGSAGHSSATSGSTSGGTRGTSGTGSTGASHASSSGSTASPSTSASGSTGGTAPKGGCGCGQSDGDPLALLLLAAAALGRRRARHAP